MVSYVELTDDEDLVLRVLILVVVDNGLVRPFLTMVEQNASRLNPYCSGRWSRTYDNSVKELHYVSLNPCCSGRWSRTTLSSL